MRAALLTTLSLASLAAGPAQARTCASPLVPPSPELNAAAPRDGLGAQKAAVVLFHYDDTTAEPWTPAQIRSQVDDLDDYYREVSYDALWLEGHLDADVDVFGWYTMPIPAAGKGTWNVLSSLESAAAADGYDYSNYDLVFFVHTEPATLWAGQWMGDDRLEMWGWNTPVAAHEGFHAMGIDHANLLSCVDSLGSQMSLDGTCVSAGYGDRYDVQGSGLGRHPNVRTKARLGWLCEEELATAPVHNFGTCRYELDPLEDPTGRLLGVQVPADRGRFDWGSIGFSPSTGADTYYYLEYRQPLGADEPLAGTEAVEGVSVRLGSALNDAFLTLLVDEDADGAGGFDEAIVPGESLVDSALGLTIRTISADASGATVEVCVGACVEWDPDGDGVADCEDNCLFTHNPEQYDQDKDGVGDVCDPCPETSMFSEGFAEWGCVDPRLLIEARLAGLVKVARDFGVDGPWEIWEECPYDCEGALEEEYWTGVALAVEGLEGGSYKQASAELVADLVNADGAMDSELSGQLIDRGFTGWPEE